MVEPERGECQREQGDDHRPGRRADRLAYPHDRALHRAMKPGGRLLAQCGGLGNIDAFRRIADTVAATEPFARYFEDWQRPWNYASAEETAERLTSAGFIEVETWLQPKRVRPERAFVETVCLVRHLDPLPDELRPRFVDRVLTQYGEPLVLDYVRLNMSAVADRGICA